MRNTFIKENKIALSILFLAWIVPVLFFCKYGKSLLDSDMAAEMVLAKQLNDEGTLISKNWFYATEIRIFAQQIFFKFGLLLFPNNWHLVRICTQAVLLLATAFSYLYMTSILTNIKKNIYFAAMLLCPFGFWHMFHNIFDGIYLLNMIFYMLCAGLIFRICLYKDRTVFRLIILSLLCFGRGIESVRLVMNLYVPMFFSSILVLYLKLRDLKGNFSCEQINRELRLVAASVYSLFFSTVGYFINACILCNEYHYQNHSKIQYLELSIERILKVLSSFLRVFGYPIDDFSKNKEYLLSPTGILASFSLILMFIVSLSLLQTTKKLPSFNLEKRLIISTCISSTLVTVIIISITESACNGSYFLPFLPAIIATLSIEWETEQFQLKFGRNLFAWILILSVICCSLSTLHAFKNYPPRAQKNIVKITESILNKGYTRGVSSFWYGNVITELSDGQIEMWLIEDLESFKMKESLQSIDHLTNLPKGKGFFIIDSAALYFDYFANIPNSELIYDRNGIKIVGVEDMQSVYADLCK